MKASTNSILRRCARAAVEGLEDRRLFATFLVTTTADSGPGSLRDAIDLANADQTLDNIDFNIAGAGVQRITPVTPLPDIISPVAINGYSQPGSQANTLAVGNDAKLLIEIHGELGGVLGTAGLNFTMDEPTEHNYRFSSGSSVRGLVLNGSFDQGAIRIGSTNREVEDIMIAGNFIGTDPTGSTYAVVGESIGILADANAIDNRIGGLTPADRNVINGGTAVVLAEGSFSTTVVNNYISLDASGTTTLGGRDGISIESSRGNLIGGATPAARNVIASNGDAVSIDADKPFGPTVVMHNRVIGNYIGTAADGVTRPAGLGAFASGVGLTFGASHNIVGGATAAEGNVIANMDLGINVVGGDHNLIRHNSIFNTQTPIRLGSGGIYNDPQDTDTGDNNGQNYAALITADATASSTKVLAFLNSRPNTSYVVDFFASPNNGDPANGQAKTFLGSVIVKTDVQGDATINADLAAAPANSYLTNTVSTLLDFPVGDTSRISPAIEITTLIPPPPPVLPTLTVANVSTTEGNSGTKTLTFTVKLSAAATGAVSVNYNTTDGTAKTGDNDYVAKTGTLTFAAGELAKTVSVTIKGDTKVESNESFNLLLSGATGATIADGAAVGSISNDDSPPPLPKLSVGGYTAKEGHSGTTAFTFKVTLDKSSTSAITVKYATANDTATAGSDYTAASGTLTFAAGQTSKTVTIYVKGDKLKEAEEKFFLLLSAPTNATIAVGTGTGRITNDD